jgi:release factor glutamine methyltransferase
MSNLNFHTISGQALWQWRQQAQAQSIAAGVPITEVDWVLQEVAGLDRLTLRLEAFKDWEEVPTRFSLTELTQLWQQRLEAKVPVQYLVGMTPWREFSLLVSPSVLIPRPETECLIDIVNTVVQNHPELAEGDWADLGTGSGAIAIALATQLPQATIHAVDLSLEALAIARQNAERMNMGDRIQFYSGNWFAALAELKKPLQGIVANPPYIPRSMLTTLQPEVTQHEPHLALDGGEDGLDQIRALIDSAPSFLSSGGIWLIEMMAGQAQTVAQLLQEQGSYRGIQIYPDLAGTDRFALAYRK